MRDPTAKDIVTRLLVVILLVAALGFGVLSSSSVTPAGALPLFTLPPFTWTLPSIPFPTLTIPTIPMPTLTIPLGPRASVSDPAVGSILRGATYTIRGTASGGLLLATVVDSVQVSTDGGATWRDATITAGAGTTSVTWDYVWALPPGPAVAHIIAKVTTVTSATGTSATYDVTIGQTFPDVLPGADYYTAIYTLADAGVIGGYADGTFGPNNPVLRAQFAKMATGAFALSPAEGMALPPFTDLGVDNPSDLYPHEYVATVYNANITKGTSATTFGPWLNINRAQVVTMVVRALQNLYPSTLSAVPDSYVNTWGTGFSSTHGSNARIAEYNHLLDGLPLDGAASNPWASMPRGEVAQVLYNVMQLLP